MQNGVEDSPMNASIAMTDFDGAQVDSNDSNDTDHLRYDDLTAPQEVVREYRFEGDRLISSGEREQSGKKGGFNPIVTLEKGADGTWRATRDIQLWKV